MSAGWNDVTVDPTVRTTYAVPNDSFRVRRYEDLEEFEVALHEEARQGFNLHSWQDTGGDQGWKIVAVFKR